MVTSQYENEDGYWRGGALGLNTRLTTLTFLFDWDNSKLFILVLVVLIGSMLLWNINILFISQEENIKTILMNPNIASVQTNAEGEKQVKLVLAFILSLS